MGGLPLKQHIIEQNHPIGLVGGGDIHDDDFSDSSMFVQEYVAADGGAGAIIKQGYVPAALIGDLDSVAKEVLTRVPSERVFHIQDQDSTDFEKCLMRLQAPLIMGLGFLGARVDHELAVFSALCRFPEKRVCLLGKEDVVFLAPPRMELPLSEGDRISLFPMAPCEATSEGLKWPLDQVSLGPLSQIATSNQALGPVTVCVDRPALLVILPRERFRQIVPLLASCPASWSPHKR
jgi:thiamine pyrophosphokinase